MFKRFLTILIVFAFITPFSYFRLEAQVVEDVNTTPKEPFVDVPTLNSIGLEWDIEGDANRNAKVEVKYRKSGESGWKNALDMFRMINEAVAQSNPSYAWVVPNKFASSILNLQENTTYDIQLELTDPDGANSIKTLTAKTDKKPVKSSNGTVRYVYPTIYAGIKGSPSYPDIQSAYNAAVAGDTILLAQGTYVYSAMYAFNKQATAENPITIEGIDKSKVILDGQGITTMINFGKSAYNIIRNVTFKNTASFAMWVREPDGVDHLVVENNIFLGISNGIMCLSKTCRSIIVLDNEMKGATIPWYPRIQSAGTAIALQGKGHSVGFNTISDFWDGITSTTTGRPDDNPNFRNSSIDFYNNHIFRTMDDCIQTDYGVHNYRVFNNLCHESLMGISTQPFYGGPDYIYRNVVYGTTANVLKLNVEPAGILVFNNTFLGLNGFSSPTNWSNSQFYNNLFWGVDGSRLGVIATGTATPETTRLDYNGYRQYASELGATYTFSWKHGTTSGNYRTFDAFKSATGLEQNGLLIDSSTFKNMINPAGADTVYPTALNFLLSDNSNVVDKGKVLNNITDNARGSAPDLGAYELGEALMQYGVRSTSAGVVCGSMDVNNDNILNILDFGYFGQKYLSKCIDPNPVVTACGRTDVNNDGVINIADFASFASRYRALSCSI